MLKQLRLAIQVQVKCIGIAFFEQEAINEVESCKILSIYVQNYVNLRTKANTIQDMFLLLLLKSVYKMIFLLSGTPVT